MGSIHRKKQKWLYQKYKEEQEKTEKKHTKVFVEKKKKEKHENREILYMIMDAGVCSIPVIVAVIGIFFMMR